MILIRSSDGGSREFLMFWILKFGQLLKGWWLIKTELLSNN